MAKAQSKTIETEKTMKVKEKVVTLTLSEEEAKFLRDCLNFQGFREDAIRNAVGEDTVKMLARDGISRERADKLSWGLWEALTSEIGLIR